MLPVALGAVGMSMSPRHRPLLPHGISTNFLLFLALLGAIWLAGGASREDALGQVVVRTAAWGALFISVLAGDRVSLTGIRPVLALLLAAIALALVQLIPLPPAWWLALPGRAVLAEAAAASGQPQPWRPWAIVPSAAANAASSLVVPLTALLLVCGSREAERRRIPGLVLGMITASTLVGLLQFSGAGVNNPFANDTPGQVSGTFANRNHFALFAAFGCALAPVWAFLGGRRPGWRGPVAIGLLLLFVLTILATGSRAGLVVGVLGLAMGLILVQRGMRRELSHYPRWTFPALIAGIVAMIAVFALFSVAAGRAVSIDRILAVDPEQDMRGRGLPTVLAMVREYFPLGSGLGGFDTMFRMHEPLALLKPTYFNHAHNDWLEIVLDAGLPGLLLLGAGIAWWAWASVRAWRAGAGTHHALPKLGSAMLLLILIASAFDYPARTPMIMVIMVIAGIWLASPPEGRNASALPETSQHL